MNLKIKFHQIDSTEAIKNKITEKCEKLGKFFEGHFDVNWTCSTGKEGHHSHAIVAGKGFTINAESTRDDLYKTFDDVITKIEKQLSKRKSQMKDKIHHKHDDKVQFVEEEQEQDYEQDSE